MVIDLKDDIFDIEKEVQFRHLLTFIFYKAPDARYSGCFVDFNVNVMEGNELYEKLSEIDQKLLLNSFKELQYRNTSDEKRFVVSDIQPQSYKIDEIIALLKSPCYIVLESGGNDSQFIKSLIHHFDSDEQFIIDSLKYQRLVFLNSGGSGAKKEIMSKLDGFNAISLKYATDNHKYFRGLVIIDGDKNFRTDDQTNKYNNLLKFLNSIDVDCHVLEKRAMENYIPIETLENVAKMKKESRDQNEIQFNKWFNVYQRLNDEQRDYLNFDKYDNIITLDDGCDHLYSAVGTENNSILVKGCSYRNDSIKDPSERRLKNAFPRLFMEDPLVNKITLKSRAGNNELEEIITKIRKIL